jgi:4-amino-4-deoxy-L-arabinose transferase-like glycosyltransferase
VDDTLFVRAGQHIVQNPFDPFGFEINWDASAQPMSQVTENPPLACYYTALIARVAGWSERALHLGYILVAILLVLGTYRLAQKFTRSPLLASLCTLFTPGLLVSASSVMCDTMMLALWIWAAYFWIEGIDSGRKLLLCISAMLCAASALTKYFGVSLILLLLAYSIVRFRRLRTELLYLLIPVSVLVGYELWTATIYGHGLLQGAAEYARSQGTRRGSVAGMSIVGLSFMGGCSLLGLTFAFLIWSRKHLLAGVVAGALASLVVAAGWLNIGWLDENQQFGAAEPHALHWFGCVELTFCIAGAIFVLALAVKDFREEKSAASVFLGLWILGTFFFAAYVNWTVNARSVLPLIPAAAILLARRFDHPLSFPKNAPAVSVAVTLMASAAVSLWITAADSELANSARDAAFLVYKKTHDRSGKLWFVGHWGFQYYLESLGVAPLDLSAPEAHSGDFVVIPRNNSHVAQILPAFISSQENVEVLLKARATTVSSELGAGFYSSNWGPLPFVIGPVVPERYTIVRLKDLPTSLRARQ